MTKSLWDEYLSAAQENYETIEQGEKYKFDLAEGVSESPHSAVAKQ